MGEAEEFCQQIKNQNSRAKKWLLSKHRRKATQFIVQRPWTCASSSTNFKYVLYYVATLWKMTQARMLCSPSRDLPRHTWQRPKFWMRFPDFHDAQDKQVMQYRLTPKWKWKRPKRYWDYQNQTARPSGFVHCDPAFRNHGTKPKTGRCSLKEICTDTNSEDCCGSDN